MLQCESKDVRRWPVVLISAAGRLSEERQNMGVSENRGPKYSTLNSRILIIRAPNKR